MRDLTNTPYDEFYWFIGMVEDVFDDPLKLGRIRVRAFGYHPSSEELRTKDLPLAPVLDGGIQPIKKGQMVLGFFMDGSLIQQPFVLGTINGAISGSGIFDSLRKLGGSVKSILEATKSAIKELFTDGAPDEEFWSLVAISSREAFGNDFQGCADVAQSIYNRVGSGAYQQKTVKGIITAPGQYEPTFANPSAWKAIKDIDTALIAVNTARGGQFDKSYLIAVANAITDTQKQQNAASFIQGRTDFLGQGQPAKAMTANGSKVCRDSRSNQFGFSYNYTKNVTYPVPSFVSKDKIPTRI
jgi:hypothetical protein